MASTTLSRRRNKLRFKSKVKSKKSKIQVKNKKLNSSFFNIGVVLTTLGLILFFLTFYPVVWQETKYSLNKLQHNVTVIKPVDEEFGIVIPKIRANAKVIENVDPYDGKIYQQALTKGVAHAAGTAYPGHVGNTFIFAHSSVDWYIANRYNSVFYLLHKLERGDKIEMYYKKKRYIYEVFDKKYVKPSDVTYLSSNYSLISNNSSLLTLMTCWPPGTTLKRLIIQAKIAN